MAKGGKRPNSGRKKGSTNNDIENIRDLLEPHRKALIEKAVKMAKAGNTTVLNKLLDKLLPNLNSVDLAGNEIRIPPIEINVIPDRKPD